jgi:hypothetical protein
MESNSLRLRRSRRRDLVSGLGYVAFSSYTGSQSDKASVDITSASESPLTDSIPYRVAEGYFASSGSLPTTITSEEELSHCIGMATTMMEAPTSIDWSREFVIPIALPSTRISTEVTPCSLHKDREGRLVLVYKVLEGKDLETSEIRPFLAVIVGRVHLVPVRLAEEK